VHYRMRAMSTATMTPTHTKTAFVPLAGTSAEEDPPLLQVRGSDAEHMVDVAHVAPALQDKDLIGLTIPLNCCFTASGQPAQAVFMHERRESMTTQLWLPDALGTAAK